MRCLNIMQEPSNIIAKLEALLFAYGEPLEKKRAARILGVSEEEIAHAAVSLHASLTAAERGLMLLKSGEELQLVTKPEFQAIMQDVMKSEMQEELTPAALETMSIVAYGGPIARSEIDYIRGVNSSFSIRSLLIRGLVERFPHPERAQVYLYRPSALFLKHIGMESEGTLPEYQTLREVVQKIRGASQ